MAAERIKTPSKETVDFLYKGLAFFYPRTIFGEEKAKTLGYLKTWSGMQSSDFALFATNITDTGDIDEAAKVVLSWKRAYDKEKYPNATIPENLDELVASLEEISDKKGNQTQKARIAKQVLLESQVAKEEGGIFVKEEPSKEKEEESITPSGGSSKVVEVARKPQPTDGSRGIVLEVIKKTDLNPIARGALKIATLPFFFAGPRVASTPEGQVTASAQHLLFRQQITSASFAGIRPRALSLGVSPSQFDNLLKAIAEQERAFPGLFNRISSGFEIQEIAVRSGIPQYTAGQLFLFPSSETGSLIIPKKSFVGNLLGRIGQQLFGKLAKKAVEKVASKAVSKVGAAIGSTTGPVGTAVGYVVGWITGKVVEKAIPFLKKYGKYVVATPIVVAGFLIGGPAGLMMIGGGALVGVGVGGLKAAASSVGSAMSFALTGLLIPSVAAPLIASLIGLPLLIAIILFIINSGAYIVPPSPSTIPGAIESPYIGIEKEASPNQIDEISGEAIINYKVRIFAKKGTLTNIRIANEYKVISNSDPDVPKPSVEEIDNPPQIISPVEDYVFEYQIPLDSSYNDSIVVDSITVQADASEQKDATARISASVVIGNPPISCPLPGASLDPRHGSYTPGVETGGHGSADYWQRMGSPYCRYGLPQGAPSCRYTNDPRARSAGNPCYNASGCSTYGYAADVFGSPGQEVFLPTVEGKTVQWDYVRSFQNGSAGNSHVYRAGQYTIVLTHMSSDTNTGSGLSSGTAIGRLHPQGGNTHIHIEFSVGGQYVRPDDYFCF